VVNFTLRPLYPEERVPVTHWIGGYVGHRAGLDTVAKRKVPVPAENRTPVFQSVA